VPKGGRTVAAKLVRKAGTNAWTQSPSSGDSRPRARCGGRRLRPDAGLSSSPSCSQRHRLALQHSGWRNCEVLGCRADERDAVVRARRRNSHQRRCALRTRWLRASSSARRQRCLPGQLPGPSLNPTWHLHRWSPVWRRERRCVYLPDGHERSGDTNARRASNHWLAGLHRIPANLLSSRPLRRCYAAGGGRPLDGWAYAHEEWRRGHRPLENRVLGEPLS
jgi:hypothetical protein